LGVGPESLKSIIFIELGQNGDGGNLDVIDLQCLGGSDLFNLVSDNLDDFMIGSHGDARTQNDLDTAD
jgi:hypothetical protein